MTETFQANVPAISCDGCANAIRRALSKLDGVASVSVDVTQKRVEVQFDTARVSPAEVRDRLARAGFPAA